MWYREAGAAMHGALKDTGVLFVLVPVRCGAAAHGKGFRLYSIVTILIFLVFGA
jgi:K+-transporting ATPase A subunit